MEWDETQLEVIFSDPQSRLLVEAGPGTGKTAIACGRIASLIGDQNMIPGKVWMLSFTRTAVREFRERIGNFLEDDRASAAVRISTLDSSAWYLNQGFREGDLPGIVGGYDANIESVIQLLEEEHEPLIDYLQEEVDHLIIDEAQDLMGVRSRLVKSLIEAVREDCGVTVFADSAQAIYGFSDDDDGRERRGELTLVDELNESEHFGFKGIELSAVHRTSDERLKSIFQDGRKVILNGGGGARERFSSLISMVREKAHGQFDPTSTDTIASGGEALYLFRTRAEVMRASSYLWSDGITHNLRMPDVEPRIHPWVGRIFAGYCDDKMSRSVFFDLWRERVGSEHLPGWNEDRAWRITESIARASGDQIDVFKLRQRLSAAKPPDELLVQEAEISDLTLGTIHASKGREANSVYLVIPSSWSKIDESDGTERDISEEGRVAFVGATRPQGRLYVAEGSRFFWKRLDNGRVYSLGPKYKSPRAQVNLGMAGDVIALEHGENPIFSSEIQDFLWAHSFDHRKLHSIAKPPDYTALLHDDVEKLAVGALSKGVNTDWFRVSDAVARRQGTGKLRPNSKVSHIHFLGSATHVASPDDERLDRIPVPYRDSGFFLKPVIFAFTNVYFRIRKS